MDRERALGESTQNSEVLLELNYRAQIAAWIYLRVQEAQTPFS